MNIIFCAYRDWAIKVLPSVKKHPKVHNVLHVTNNEELYAVLKSSNVSSYDFVLFCGWSTPPSEEATKIIPMFSEHPATSDRYSPGTPLQNQILDGKTHTKHRLVKVGYPELSERKWSHEVDMDLSGNMDDILEQMEVTAKFLFNKFLNDWPGINWNVWDEVPTTKQVARRTPDMSELTSSEVKLNITAKELYDRIRCLESPYPNAFIEDETGCIYFNKVSFKSK